jgi:hypothetical protein
MNILSSVVVFVLVGASGVVRVGTGDADESVKLSGCVIKGLNGYVLTNVPRDETAGNAEAETIEPGPVGTSGTDAAVFYWLVDDTERERQVGHQVEIEGEWQGAARTGEMKIQRQANWTDIEVESDGQTFRARLPESLFALSPPGLGVVNAAAGTTSVTLLVRAVKPRHVRMLADSCHS